MLKLTSFHKAAAWISGGTSRDDERLQMIYSEQRGAVTDGLDGCGSAIPLVGQLQKPGNKKQTQDMIEAFKKLRNFKPVATHPLDGAFNKAKDLK